MSTEEPLYVGHCAEKGERAKICALQEHPGSWETVNSVGIFHLDLKLHNWKGTRSLYFSDDENKVREGQ